MNAGSLAVILAAAAVEAAAVEAAPAAHSPAPREYASQEKIMPKGYKDFALPEGRFRCRLPKTWAVSRDPSRDGRQKVFGIAAVGPGEKGGPEPRLSVDYYAPGNTLFPDAAAFLARQLAPRTVALKGEKNDPVVETRVAGRPAWRLGRRTFEYVPPHSLQTREIPIREERVVLEHEGGFFVLTLAAPQAGFKKNGRHFETLLKSFETLPGP